VAKLTGLLRILAGYPEGMRIIVRREHPHLAAQLDACVRTRRLPLHRPRHLLARWWVDGSGSLDGVEADGEAQGVGLAGGPMIVASDT
jgi:hypothetical protein